MADQTLAQTGALKMPDAELVARTCEGEGRGFSGGANQKPQIPQGGTACATPPRRVAQYTLGYKIGWRWRLVSRWVRFLLAGASLSAPELVDFIFTNRYFAAYQVPSELAALGEILAQRRPKCALEIGTARGGTLLFLTRLASPRAVIVSVDLPGGEFGGGYSARRKWCYQRFARSRQRLHLVEGDSHSADALRCVKAAFGGQPLDYLFIDGDHRYEGVKRDFEMYSPLVGKGGLIALHDIVDGPSEAVGGVPDFWREIRSRYRYREIIQDANQGGYGLGVLYVD